MLAPAKAPSISEYKETARLGSLLAKEAAGEVEAAAAAHWESEAVEQITRAVSKYFGMISHLARWFGAAIFVPLLILIFALVGGSGDNRSYLNIYLAWLIAVGLCASKPMLPLLAVIRAIRRLPEAEYRKLISPLWVSLDVFHTAASLGCLAYIIQSWNIITSFPIVGLLILAWVVSPWFLYIIKLDRSFVTVKAVQLVVLLGAALFSAASPVPMMHYQHWLQQESVRRLRPVEQKEVTADWETLMWFTPEGAPNIWYSFSEDRGYRLYLSPGHDPSTNQELAAVSDKATRDRIAAAMAEARAVEERKRILTQERNAAQANAARALRDRQAANEQEQKLAEDRARLIGEFVTPRAKSASAPASAALVVRAVDKNAVPGIEGRIASLLSEAGFDNANEVFTARFGASDEVERILAGSPVDTFRPEQYAKRLIVVEASNDRGQRQSIAGSDLMLVNATLRVRLIALDSYHEIMAFELRASGTGFDEASARSMAYERCENAFREKVPLIASKLTTEK